MTTQVFECQHRKSTIPAHVKIRPRTEDPPANYGLTVAALLALVVVPLAGAAEPPNGWIVAGLTALALLALIAIAGQHVRWGWLTLLVGGAGLVAPRGQLSVIGPSLFVATALCLVVWLTSRGGRRKPDARPRPGSPEHAAQLVMGLSGERHVANVLAHELPEEYALINGLTLPRSAGDIDHLVVGPSGVFLLETKTMAGRIMCEPDGTWRRTRVGRAGTSYAAYIGNPAAQVLRNIFAVRECLRRRVPQVFRGTPLWIEGLVVFPHPRTELQAAHSRIPAVLLEQAPARICMHVPQRPLQPDEISAVLHALLEESRQSGATLVKQSAQALVETALLLPVLLTLVLGTLAISRFVQTQTAVITVAHEAARAGALATNPEDAAERMLQRVAVVAPGLGLDAHMVVVDWDLSHFGSDPGEVIARVRYPLDYADLPAAGWVAPSSVQAEHVEWIDPFRSGLAARTRPTDEGVN